LKKKEFFQVVVNSYELNRNVLLSKGNALSSNNSVIQSASYTVNGIGQRTGVNRSGSSVTAGDSVSYRYDKLGQVTYADESNASGDRSYEYDQIGNRIRGNNALTPLATSNYIVNNLNQYTGLPLVSSNPTYDADGNMTGGFLPANTSGNSILTYDGENRMISSKLTSAGVVTNYQYDALSRRISKQTVGGVRTSYLYDGWNCIAEYVNTTASVAAQSIYTIERKHSWGMDLSNTTQGAGGVGGLLQTTLCTGTGGSTQSNNYPLYDGNGNVTDYVSQAGITVASYKYDAFGNVHTSSGSLANTFNCRFSTKVRDVETGLYYYGYRYYNTTTGKWINRDPIEETGGVSLYGFVGNDGIGAIDFDKNIGIAENHRFLFQA
jgi:RHS repeat-associated protein